MRVTTTTGTLVATLLWAGLASAQLTPQASLKKCQDTVTKASQKYIDGQLKAASNCLSKVSSEILGKNAASIDGAVGTCVKELRKLFDTRGLGKSFREQFLARVKASCEPGQPGVTHTQADLLGPGAAVPESTQVGNLDVFCSSVSGPVTDVTSWIDCLDSDSRFHVLPRLIAVRFPRAANWLTQIHNAVDQLSPPASDVSQYEDVKTAASVLRTGVLTLLEP